MPILNKPFETFERPGLVVNYAMANVRIYKGAMVGLNTDGFAQPMSPDDEDLLFVGVANESFDNRDGEPGDASINLTKSGSFVFAAVEDFVPVQADLGKAAFAASDYEVTVDDDELDNAYAVGTIIAIETTSTGAPGVRVRIDNATV